MMEPCGGGAAASLRRNVDQCEPLLAHRIGKAFVQRDHLKRCGTAFRGNERRGELQRIGCPQRMHAQEPDCIFADKLARFDLVPGRALRDLDELSEPITDVEADGKGLPILLRQYAKIGGKLLGFMLPSTGSANWPSSGWGSRFSGVCCPACGR